MSSSEALQSIKTKSFPSTAVICTADVKSLYPSIPTALGLDCIQRLLEISKKFTTSKIRLIIQLMRWVLTNNFIQFNGDIYLQIEGTAMGTPMAPTYAILFMFAIERQHINRALYYKRYIDDIFGIFNSADHFNDFVHAINSVIPDRLKLEAIICGSEGIFLDIKFKLNDGNLSYQLYQKPNNTYAYIPTISDHPRSMFKSFILEELTRYHRNCSDFNIFQSMAILFKDRLQRRGYHSSLFNTAYQTLLQRISLNKNKNIILKDHPTQQTSRPHSKNNFVQKKLTQPILIISLPVLNHSINWRSFIDIPVQLRDTLAFQLAFKSAHVIISKCTPNTLGSLYISSTF